MKRNAPKKCKNKYFIPTLVISVLLVIAFSLLLFVLFGERKDLSVSKNNVIGNARLDSVVDTVGDNRLSMGMLRLGTSPLKVTQDSHIFSISWLTGNDADVTFSVSDLYPGDSVTKECKLLLNTWKVDSITLTKEIIDGTLNQKLADILLLKVEFLNNNI